MALTAKQRKGQVALEIRDMLTGAAFPVMLQLVFSTSIILFASYTEELALSIVALLFGEALLCGAYVIFGRQNGITAYRRTVQGNKKRELQPDDSAAQLKTGEYAVWKGIVIGLISMVPYIIFQFIECIAPNTVCGFVLRYAFGWAEYPFILIELAAGELSEWLNFVWMIVFVGIHAASYVWGANTEIKRQKKVQQAQELKDKRRK